jgi:hypothetical protein
MSMSAYAIDRCGRDGPADGPAENDGIIDIRKQWGKIANGRRYRISTARKKFLLRFSPYDGPPRKSDESCRIWRQRSPEIRKRRTAGFDVALMRWSATFLT